MTYSISTRSRQGYYYSTTDLANLTRPVPKWTYTQNFDYPVKNLAQLQDELDKRLSRRAQFEYALNNQILQNGKFVPVAGTTRIHWKDVVKFCLLRDLYGYSYNDMASKYKVSTTTLNDMESWAKYKYEGFHKLFVRPLNLKDRCFFFLLFSRSLNLSLNVEFDSPGLHPR